MVLMQADITVGALFMGKASVLDISVITTGQATAIGITATGAIPTAVMATEVIRAGAMAMVILMGVTGMEVIRA